MDEKLEIESKNLFFLKIDIKKQEQTRFFFLNRTNRRLFLEKTLVKNVEIFFSYPNVYLLNIKILLEKYCLHLTI